MDRILKVGQAIAALRARADDKHIGSRVEAGKFQLVRTTYVKGGKSEVEELSGWKDFEEFVAYVNAQ